MKSSENIKSPSAITLVVSIYRFVNNKQSCKRGLGALGDGKGEQRVSNAERADLLNN